MLAISARAESSLTAKVGIISLADLTQQAEFVGIVRVVRISWACLSFAAFDCTAPSSGTYRMRVTFFESVITGTLRVSRK